MVRSASMRPSFSKYSASSPPAGPYTIPNPSSSTSSKTHQHQQQARTQPIQHAGHRLIIVSLFLRETVQFHTIEQQQQQQQQQQQAQQAPEQPLPQHVDAHDPQTDTATPLEDGAGTDSAPASLTAQRTAHSFTQPPITPHHPHADPTTAPAQHTTNILTADPAVQQQAQLHLHEELTAHSTRTQPAPPSPPEHVSNPGDRPCVPSSTNNSGSGGGANQAALPIHELPARLHSFTLAHPPHSHHHSLSQPGTSSSHSTSASRRASSSSQAFKAGFFAHSLEAGGYPSASVSGGGVASRSSSVSTATADRKSPSHQYSKPGSVGSAGSGTNSAGPGATVAPLSIINDLANKQQAKQAAAAAGGAGTGAGGSSSTPTGAQSLSVGGGTGSVPAVATPTAAAPHTPSLLQAEARHNPFASAAASAPLAAGLASGAITPRRTTSPFNSGGGGGVGGSTTPGGLPNRLGAFTAIGRSPAILSTGTAMSASSSGAGSGSSGAAPPVSNPIIGSPLPTIPSTPILNPTTGTSTGTSSPAATNVVKPTPKSFFQQTLSRPPAAFSNLKNDGSTGTATGGGGSASQSIGALGSSLTAPSSPGLSSTTAGAAGVGTGGGGLLAPGSVAAQHRKAAGASLLGRSASSGPTYGSPGGTVASNATLVSLDHEHPQAFGVVTDHGRAAVVGSGAGVGGAAGGGATGASSGDSGRILRPEHVFASVSPAPGGVAGARPPSAATGTEKGSAATSLAGLGIQDAPTQKKVQGEESSAGPRRSARPAEGGRELSSSSSGTTPTSLPAVNLPSGNDDRGRSAKSSSSSSSINSGVAPAGTATSTSTSTSRGSTPAGSGSSGSGAASGTRSPSQNQSQGQGQNQVTPTQSHKRGSRERGPISHMVPSSTSMATSRTSGGSGARSRSRHHYHQAPLPRRTSSVASLESHHSSGTVTTTTSNAAGGGGPREMSSCTPTSEHPDEEGADGFERAEHVLYEEEHEEDDEEGEDEDEEEEEEEEEEEYLFGFDFVPNPSANGGLFNAVESLGTLGQGRYGAKGRLKKHGSSQTQTGGNATPAHAPGSNSANNPTAGPGSKPGVVGLGLGGGGDRDAVLRRSTNRLFIGTLGVSIDNWLGPNQKDLIERRLLDERQAVPVWVDDATFERSYHDFCKALLWPTFHYTLPGERALEKQNEAFGSYIDVNRAFAHRIAENWREGDIVWINDYHLLLVPQMLRELLGPSATIGLFMHISFPSSEMFRCLSVRETLLRGMLGADLLGFQTHNNCRHFRQTVSRILQLEATPKGIQLDSISGRGGFVTVNAFPIGIDVRSLNLKRREPDVEEWIHRLETRYEGRKIIVGRDKLDWIKGVRQKLLAYELFLDEHPEWVGQVVLIQVALATTEENEEAGQASDVVARINRRWGSLTYQPVVFLHVQDITFSQYLALLTVADAFLASSLREGMALTPHEYIICQEVKHRPLILSEFVGSYSSLRACLGFNPFNTKQASVAISKALTMDEDEMFERWQDLHRTVVTQTAQHWITSFLSRLERAHAEQQFRDTAFIPRLEIAQLVSEWRAAKTRLILLDLEDTLVSETPLSLHKSGFRPSEKLLARLSALSADPKNSVYVLSGMGMVNLTALSEAVPRLGLIAENGCFVKHCGEGERSWISLVAGFNLQWRAPVKDILAYFTERTPGSWMEDRGASICWVYWNEELGDAASHEAQWARRQAAEVQNLIYDSLAERFSLRIIPGPASFLCSPKNTSRASAVQHIMQMSAMGGFWNGGNMIVPGQIVDPTSSAFRTNMSGRGGGGGSGIGSPRKSQLDAVLREEAMKTSGRAKSDQSAADLPYKLPSNHWPVPQPSAPRSAAKDRVPMETMGVRNLQGLFGFGPAAAEAQTMQPNAGSFDFVLAIGQDEGLLRYVNGLDLPFAPVTCTTVDLTRSKGSDAGNHLEGVEDVEEALDEILEFRERDRRWGRPVMTDV